MSWSKKLLFACVIWALLGAVSGRDDRTVATQRELHTSGPKDAFKGFGRSLVLDVDKRARADARGLSSVEPAVNVGDLFVFKAQRDGPQGEESLACKICPYQFFEVRAFAYCHVSLHSAGGQELPSRSGDHRHCSSRGPPCGRRAVL